MHVSILMKEMQLCSGILKREKKLPPALMVSRPAAIRRRLAIY